MLWLWHTIADRKTLMGTYSRIWIATIRTFIILNLEKNPKSFLATRFIGKNATILTQVFTNFA